MFRFIKQRFNDYIRKCIMPAFAECTTAQVVNAFRREQMMLSALHCQEKGIAEPKEGETPLIVSLTTHGERLYEVCIAIESIMLGSMKPNAIVLWIGDNEPTELPISLQRQIRRGLSVKRTRDIRSYTKLVPALQQYPDANIVTIDDDILYPLDFLENLLVTHRLHPNAIVANMVMRLTRAADGVPEGIKLWPYTLERVSGIDADLYFEGFGGVLYPAGSMPKETLNESVFLNISPTNDDAWLNSMARIAGRPIIPCNLHPYDYIAAVNPNVQSIALYHTNNTAENLNDKQIRSVWEHYQLQWK